MNELSSERTPVAAVPAPPPYPLYDYRSVGLASFLGTPLGGGVLLAMNYRRLGNRAAAAGALALGIVVTSLLLLLGFSGVANTGVQAIGLLSFIGMMQGAKAVQGFDVDEHVRLGGWLASKGSAAIAGLLCLAVVAVVVFGIVSMGNPSRTKITRGADSFVVQDGAWEDNDKVSKFQDVGRLIAPAAGGLPFELRFLDTGSKVKKQVTVR